MKTVISDQLMVEQNRGHETRSRFTVEAQV